MTQMTELVARYHKLIESEPYRDLVWAETLQEQIRAAGLLVSGRPVSPVLRPHFLSRKQYAHLAKAAEELLNAVERAEQLALHNTALMARMQLLPAEKMLAAMDPGYRRPAVTALLDTSVHNGSLHFTQYNPESGAGLAYTDVLGTLFAGTGPMQELRKRYTLQPLGGADRLLQALLAAYQEFGGKRQPQIAILTFRQPFPSIANAELPLFVELFRKAGYAAEMVTPEQLEYRNGVLRKGDFEIHLIYRQLRMAEFLVRCDLNHPLVRAYRDRAVCVVNSFRSEMAQKRAIFHLLTDEAVTAGFPASERKAIREHIPWTRLVTAAKTQYGSETVDLPEFIRLHREQLVLKPNDSDSEDTIVVGAQTAPSQWERAIRNALRASYVVQEAVEPADFLFPLYRNGSLEMKMLRVDVQPHSFLGEVHGCSSWLSTVGAGGFTQTVGLAPTFVVDR